MNTLRGELIRFGIVGVVNSIFGYFVGVGLFQLFSTVLPAFVISLAANAIAIVFSFTTQKIFVFRVRGDWLRQFVKGVAVYSVITLIGSLLFALLIDRVGFNVWISQAIVIVCTAVIGFLGSKLFTFRATRRQ